MTGGGVGSHSHSLTLSFVCVCSASTDNIRLWNMTIDSSYTLRPDASSNAKPSSAIPFTIIPGHHGGMTSHIGKIDLKLFD